MTQRVCSDLFRLVKTSGSEERGRRLFGHTDGQPKHIKPPWQRTRSASSDRTSPSARDPWRYNNNFATSAASYKTEEGREKRRGPDVCVNRLNCRAASPDYFFALIFSLVTAASPLPVTLTNPSITSLKYATKIGCYLLLWQPININRLHEDSSGILDVLMQSLKKKEKKSALGETSQNHHWYNEVRRGRRGQRHTCCIHMDTIMVH